MRLQLRYILCIYGSYYTVEVKLNLYYIRLIPFQVSRVSGVHLRGFAPGPTHQGCKVASRWQRGRFNRLGI